MKLRVVNYYTTDEDGEKVYTGYVLQSLSQGAWRDVPVVEQEEPERLHIVTPDAKKA